MFQSRKSLIQENIALKAENAKLIEKLREQKREFRENISTPDLVSYGPVKWQRTKSIDSKCPYCPLCGTIMRNGGAANEFVCGNSVCRHHCDIPKAVFDDIEKMNECAKNA